MGPKRLAAVSLLAFLLGALPAPGAAEDVQPALTVADCAKCHREVPHTIAAEGMAHGAQITCLDCHAGHPPLDLDVIPACSQCHSGEPHFEQERCLTCHRDPHAPLRIVFADDLTEPCLACHETQGVQLTQFRSFHSSMACSDCHGQHRLVPECLGCHEAHAPAMVQGDCSLCHHAHMPLEVAYAADVGSEHCAACHERPYAQVQASATRHRDLSCPDCHANRHGTVPRCGDCHGIPHAEGILAHFRTCGECHNTAHDLNHWEASAR